MKVLFCCFFSKEKKDNDLIRSPQLPQMAFTAPSAQDIAIINAINRGSNSPNRTP